MHLRSVQHTQGGVFLDLRLGASEQLGVDHADDAEVIADTEGVRIVHDEFHLRKVRRRNAGLRTAVRIVGKISGRREAVDFDPGKAHEAAYLAAGSGGEQHFVGRRGILLTGELQHRREEVRAAKHDGGVGFRLDHGFAFGQYLRLEVGRSGLRGVGGCRALGDQAGKRALVLCLRDFTGGKCQMLLGDRERHSGCTP